MPDPIGPKLPGGYALPIVVPPAQRAAEPRRVGDLLVAKPAPGSVAMGPRDVGDQGLSQAERAAGGDRLMDALLTAPGTQFVATVRDGEYELRSNQGSLRFRRFRQPDGSIVFTKTGGSGGDPVASVDPRALGTLAEEQAAAGGPGKPTLPGTASDPDVLRRVSSLFDHRYAPDVVVAPTSGGDPDHPGKGVAGGNHGNTDVVQSRAPLIFAGPGISAGVRSAALANLRDVAPTIAQALGVLPLGPGDATTGLRYLGAQEGHTLSSAVTPAATDAALTGAAQQALMFILDGTNAGVLRDELAAGNLPNIASLAAGGTMFDNGAMAEFPSVTWTNHSVLTTSAGPGSTGIIGNNWYDRRTGLHDLAGNSIRQHFFTAKLLDPRVETLYEAVHRTFGDHTPTAAINEPSGRGAGIATLDPTLRGTGTILHHLPSTAVRWAKDRNDVPDTPALRAVPDWKTNSQVDNLGTSLTSSLYGHGHDPKLAVLELLSVDSTSHYAGPQSVAAREALRNADRNVGRVLDRLRATGALDHTMIVVTADHGHEHQELANSGGWAEALAKTKLATIDAGHNIYLRSARLEPVPGGDAGAFRVLDDDVDMHGVRPPLAGAHVRVTGGGTTTTLVAGDDGTVRLPAELAAVGGSATVSVDADGIATLTGDLASLLAAGAAPSN